MAGTKLGGVHARDTNYKRHGKDFYRKLGAIGGSRSRTGGFYVNRDMARIAGKLGGTISRRGRTKLSLSERQKKRLQFEKTYGHLMEIHKQAMAERAGLALTK